MGQESRLLPLVGLALFVGVGFVWRTWLQRRRYGTSGFVLFRSGRWVQHLQDGLAVLLVVVLGWDAGERIAAELPFRR